MEKEGGGEAGRGGAGRRRREAGGTPVAVGMDPKEGRERRSQGWRGSLGKNLDVLGGIFVIKI